MRKFSKILKILILGILFGVIISFLVYHSIGKYLVNSLFSVSFIVHILLFFLFIFANLVVHELGHLITAKFYNIKVKALYLFIFVFYRNEENKFKFKIDFKLAKLLGGLVLIEPPVVNNEIEYESIINKFQTTIKNGPRVNIFFTLIILFITILLLFFMNLILSGILINLTITTIIFTLYVYKISNFKYKEFYGDLIYVKELKTNELLKMNLLVSNIDDTTYSSFMIEKIKELITRNIYLINNMLLQNLILTYIDLVLTDQKYYDEILSASLLNINLKTIILNEDGYILLNYLYIHYYQINNVSKAEECINYLMNPKNKVDDKIELFWKTYIPFLIEENIAEIEKLETDKKLYPNSTAWIYGVVKEKEVYHKQINKI